MKVELPLAKARYLAEAIKNTLEPVCERIEIAGSIRRQKAIVGDIEIVAIPKMCPNLEAQLSLFGEPPKLVSALDLLLDKLVMDKENFRRGDKNGELFKNFLVSTSHDGSEIGLDLFITTSAQWGYILALRTGPGDFNRAWVTQRSKGGLLPDEYHFAGGWLWRGIDQIATYSESDIFKLIGGWIEPQDRDSWGQHIS